MVDDRKEHVQRKHNEKPRPDEPVLLGTAIDLVLARILGTLNAEP